MHINPIAPHLWHWTAPHPDWKPESRGEDGQGWDQTVSSYAFLASDEFVLIDPQVPADKRDADELWQALDQDVGGHGSPAILITVSWHARSAREIAERYRGSTIWAPADLPDEVARELGAPTTYSTGNPLPGEIRAYAVPRLSETVIYLPSHRAVAFGDVVLDGVRICPEDWLENDVTRKDVADALRPLLDEEIDLLLLTHGGPIADDARAKLERALEV